MISHFKKSNKNIEKLQRINIKLIKYYSMPKTRQKMASLVIKISNLIFPNAVLNCIIFLCQKVFGGVVFNRKCKFLQYF